MPAADGIKIDLERDKARFHVSERGIVVVPRAYFPAPSAA